MNKGDKDTETIGIRGYVVSMRDGEVILITDMIERNMKPQEALHLLAWLERHKSELEQASQKQEQ